MDLCPNGKMDGGADSEDNLDNIRDMISASFKKGVIPTGGPDAGKYLRDYHAKNLFQCVVSCCDSPDDCNVMFYSEEKCFLIACNASWPEGCDPIRSKQRKFADAYMLLVRG